MIVYDDKLNERIYKIVKAFNRKASNLQSKGRPAPKLASVAGIKKTFRNSKRSELDAYLKDLERFNKRGSEKTQTIRNKIYSQYDIDLFKLNLQRERLALNKEIESAITYNPVSDSENDAYSKQLLNRAKRLNKSWQELIRNQRTYNSVMAKKKTINETKANYLDVLMADAEKLGYDPEKIKVMKAKLSKLSPRGLQYMLENEPLAKVVFDYYHFWTRDEEFAYEDTPYSVFDAFYENLDYIVSQYK